MKSLKKTGGKGARNRAAAALRAETSRNEASIDVLAAAAAHVEQLLDDALAGYPIATHELLAASAACARATLAAHETPPVADSRVRRAPRVGREVLERYVFVPARRPRDGSYHRYHWPRADGGTRSLCGVSQLLLDEPVVPTSVAPYLRCARNGCQHRWAVWLRRPPAPGEHS